MAPPVYAACVETLGVAGTIAVLHLVAQYQLVSSLLVCFEVPVPGEASGGTEMTPLDR